MDRVGSILDVFLAVIICGVAAAYPLRSLILIERDDHEGPFRSKTLFVRFPSTGHVQRVALFDWIRRLTGVYEVTGVEWVVREGTTQVERITCPFCLSWWASLPFSIGLSLYFRTGLIGIPAHFAIAIIAQVAYKYLFQDD